MKKPTVIVIVGPTASGKTGLAVDIALRLNGEVISADSMQIYRGMDIATAKPTVQEMRGIKHHLIDLCDIGETFSAAKFKELAQKAADDILSRGKTPIVAGGTGLYIDTLINNTTFIDGDSGGVRKELETRAREHGIESLMNELERVDPQTARSLHINNAKRIIRALELYYSTGMTMTQQRKNSHLEQSRYSFCIIGLTARNRQYLYDRIDMRVEQMMSRGLLEEAREFYKGSYSPTSCQAIGYKELKRYLDGELSLDEAVDYLKMQTRRYAKRQLTWFRKNERINWLFIDELQPDELLLSALEIVRAAQHNSQPAP